MTLLNPNPHFLFFTMIHLTHHPPVSWWKYLQDLLCVWEKKMVSNKNILTIPQSILILSSKIHMFRAYHRVLLGKSSPETMVLTLQKRGVHH